MKPLWVSFHGEEVVDANLVSGVQGGMGECGIYTEIHLANDGYPILTTMRYEDVVLALAID